MFTWEESHGHYVACLSSDAPKHFLHHECLQQLGIPLSSSLYCFVVQFVSVRLVNEAREG